MLKRAIIAVTALVVALAAAVAADYAGAFGLREMQMQDLLHLRLKIIDRSTGKVVTGVHVTCVRRGSEEACSQKPETGEGTVELNFVVLKSARFTPLFKFRKAEKLWLSGEDELVLVLIHPDYERLFLPIDPQRLEPGRDQVEVVELTPFAVMQPDGNAP
ncbi:MAG: hypothetical protein ACT4NU_08505 [Chromatiales bacterium]